MGRKINRAWGTSYYKHDMEIGKRDKYGVRTLRKGEKPEIEDANKWVDMALLAIRSMDLLEGKAVENTGKCKYNSPQELQQAIREYWQYIIQRNSDGELRVIPDVEGMALFLGVTRNALRKWEVENTNGMGETVQVAKNAIAAYKKQMGLSGQIPPVFAAIDFNNNHGYTQRQEIEVIQTNPLGDAASVQELIDKYDTIEYDE